MAAPVPAMPYRYKADRQMTEEHWLRRVIFLETTAGKPQSNEGRGRNGCLGAQAHRASSEHDCSTCPAQLALRHLQNPGCEGQLPARRELQTQPRQQGSHQSPFAPRPPLTQCFAAAAGVPGMVGGMLRHLHSLRKMT